MTGHQRQILDELRHIEEKHGVKILYACESGSRAWGFPSQNSDYDVRFLYVHPVAWYLSIEEKRDVIECPIHDMLDINGWELRKALKLFKKSNPPLLEWLYSPIQYHEAYTVAERLRQLAQKAFSPRAAIYHYLHMAKGNFRGYLTGERVKIKKYFYVLRPVLGCLWIQKHQTMPPLVFEQLVEELIPEGSRLRADIDALLVRKKAGDELDVGALVESIHVFLEEQIAHLEKVAGEMPVAEGVSTAQLDELFRSALDEVWSATGELGAK
ncbi:hypothetical protein C1X05_04460 [Laceyella sacchari]|nr:hypothetical protein C1X05_04460 [Laceyella sacchari]